MQPQQYKYRTNVLKNGNNQMRNINQQIKNLSQQVNELDQYNHNDQLTDKQAKMIENVWKQAFPDASILPVIGLPSYKNNGVMTLTHGMQNMPLMSINGLISKSPLANNALFSTEISNGKFLNLYEIMIPDIPGNNGDLSTAEFYIKTLGQLGLDVAGVHFHWTGGQVFPNDKNATAVHHQNIGMDPLEFSKRTIRAIQLTALEIMKRSNYFLNH